MTVSGGRCDNVENMPTSDGPQSPGPQQEDHNHRPPNLEYQTFSPYHVSQRATNTLNCWMDERVSPSWQWEVAWSKELRGRKPCLSDQLLGLIPVKCESQWPYSAQHSETYTTHTQPMHRTHTHTHTHRPFFTEAVWVEGLGPFGLL